MGSRRKNSKKTARRIPTNLTRTQIALRIMLNLTLSAFISELIDVYAYGQPPEISNFIGNATRNLCSKVLASKDHCDPPKDPRGSFPLILTIVYILTALQMSGDPKFDMYGYIDRTLDRWLKEDEAPPACSCKHRKRK